ncbi:MAG: FAD-dependent oxidoreductase, partial [Halobacteriota archaeon]|nr:FAD-dependent oxidoreductase [Halobacteriota archaeon]
MTEETYDIIIIGAGPAGLTAGLYTSRAEMSTLILGEVYDSQATKTDIIENYPGFPEGISGMELVVNMSEQAKKYGSSIQSGMVKEIEVPKEGGRFKVVTDDGNEHFGLSLIISSGTTHRNLGVKGESDFMNRGVSYCATCDGPLFRDKDLAVVGGGNTAVSDALFLSKFAKSVSIIHRRDRLRADKILQTRAFGNEKIKLVWDSIVTEVLGSDMIEGVKLKNVKTEEVSDLAIEGLFVMVGIMPRTEFLEGIVELDSGYIVTDRSMKTS